MIAAPDSATPYAALNAVLEQFVSGVRQLLAGNFVGAYLQGSFAVGDFDEHSDVDFLVAVRRNIDAAELTALNALHDAIHAFPKPWGHRLEGSYFPLPILRRATADRLLYLDHGSRRLVRSEHDNTHVVRWVTRERGIVLAGPDPRALIDEVSADDLREEMHQTMRDWSATFLPDPRVIRQLWHQGLIVISYCRMLHALEKGAVMSKKAAAEWARQNLEARWRPLIEESLRARPSQSLGPADPQAVAETIAFVEHVMRRDTMP